MKAYRNNNGNKIILIKNLIKLFSCSPYSVQGKNFK